MNFEKTELPNTDNKYLGFVVDELVILKPRFSDGNYSRVYKVLEVNGTEITVAAITEIPINTNIHSQSHRTFTKEDSLIGKAFSAQAVIFEPYM